jgi:DNA-binding transcriptional MerR regulator
MPTEYRIGEFAELGGVSAKTLRFYDEIDLLRPASVDPRTRYRLYHSQQLQDLAAIVALKELGISLAEVRELTSKRQSARQRRQALLDVRAKVVASIHTATQSLAHIDSALLQLDQCQVPIDVIVKRQPSLLIASIRSRVEKYEDIETCGHELHASLSGNSASHLRGVLWHRCADSDFLEGEAFVGLTRRVLSNSAFEVRQLPSATLACAYCSNEEQSAEAAYDALRKWMSLRGYRLSGPKREIYRNELLEIQFPLASV